MDGNSPADLGPDDLPFTDAMIRVLADARAESYRLHHEFLGTEHLVLALTNPDSVDGAVLTRLGIDRERVRAPSPEWFSVGTPPCRSMPSARSPLGPRRRFPEHVIVGLLRERMNAGAQVLNHHGLTVDKAAAGIRPDANTRREEP